MKKALSVIILLTVLLTGAFGWGHGPPITQPFYLYLKDLIDVVTTTPNDNDVLTYNATSKLWGPEVAAISDAFTLKVDAAATADYFGVAGGDGLFRFTANHFTMADGGNFVTLSLADHATARTALGLAIGSDVQAWDADLDTYAGITPSANIQTFLGAANYAAMVTQLSLTIGTNTQAWDADLDTYAGITPSANVQTFLANANFAAMMADLSATAGAAFDWNAQLLDDAIGYCYEAETTQTPSSSFTVDWTAKHIQRVTITGVALDITFTNPPGPCRLWLVVVQGDGDDTIDWTNEADIIFPGDGVDPVLSTDAGDVDMVTFIWDGTSYLGVANYDFN